MRVEPAADAGDEAGDAERQDLVRGHVQPLHLGQHVVLADHAEDRAEAGALQEEERAEHGREQAVDHQHVLERRNVVLEDVADVAEAIGAVGTHHLAVDLDPVLEHLEDEADHLGEGKRGDREIEPACAEGRYPDQDRRRRGDRRAPEEPGPEIPPPHRGGDARRVGADREERLLPERDLAHDQQQIGRQRDERDHPDIGQHPDQVVVHRSYPPVPYRGGRIVTGWPFSRARPDRGGIDANRATGIKRNPQPRASRRPRRSRRGSTSSRKYGSSAR